MKTKIILLSIGLLLLYAILFVAGIMTFKYIYFDGFAGETNYFGAGFLFSSIGTLVSLVLIIFGHIQLNNYIKSYKKWT